MIKYFIFLIFFTLTSLADGVFYINKSNLNILYNKYYFIQKRFYYIFYIKYLYIYFLYANWASVLGWGNQYE